MLRSGLVVVALLLSVPGRAAAPQFSGFIDTSWVQNARNNASQTNALRSHDIRANSIQLNTAYLRAEGKTEDALGYVVAVDYGADAAVHRSADPRGGNAPDQFDVQEAYFTYQMPRRFGAKVGKFVTLMGIEVMKSPDNPTMTRGFLFGLAEPYAHTGALFTYDLPSVVQLGAGVVNGWDLLTDNNRGKTAIWRVGIDLGPLFNGAFDGAVGPEKNGNGKDLRSTFDATFNTKFIPPLNIAWQALYGKEVRVVDKNGDGTPEAAGDWWGFTVQPVWTISDRYDLGTRYEYFQDNGGSRVGAGNTRTVLQNVTLTPGWNVTKSLKLRAEYRYDWSARRGGSSAAQAFEDANGVFSKRNQTTIGLEAIYKFGA